MARKFYLTVRDKNDAPLTTIPITERKAWEIHKIFCAGDDPKTEKRLWEMNSSAARTFSKIVLDIHDQRKLKFYAKKKTQGRTGAAQNAD